MQLNHLDIYKIVTEGKEEDEQLYKDIGSFIFKETSEKLKNPNSLILKLKGIGTWYLRKKRMEIVVNEWSHRAEIKTEDEFESEYLYLKYKQKHDQYINFKERLKEYDEYIKLRDEIREQRHKTQIPINIDYGEKFKSS